MRESPTTRLFVALIEFSVVLLICILRDIFLANFSKFYEREIL